jgi:hypothetical protein
VTSSTPRKLCKEALIIAGLSVNSGVVERVQSLNPVVLKKPQTKKSVCGKNSAGDAVEEEFSLMLGHEFMESWTSEGHVVSVENQPENISVPEQQINDFLHQSMPNLSEMFGQLNCTGEILEAHGKEVH